MTSHVSISSHGAYEIVNDASSATIIPPRTTISFYTNFGTILPVPTAQKMWDDLKNANADEYKNVGYPVTYHFENNKNVGDALTDDQGNFIRIYEKTDTFAGAWTHNAQVQNFSPFSDIWGASKFSASYNTQNYDTILNELKIIHNGAGHLNIHAIHCLTKY